MTSLCLGYLCLSTDIMTSLCLGYLRLFTNIMTSLCLGYQRLFTNIMTSLCLGYQHLFTDIMTSLCLGYEHLFTDIMTSLCLGYLRLFTPRTEVCSIYTVSAAAVKTLLTSPSASRWVCRLYCCWLSTFRRMNCRRVATHSTLINIHKAHEALATRWPAWSVAFTREILLESSSLSWLPTTRPLYSSPGLPQ